MLQLGNQLLHVVLRVETKAMHTSIQLDVYREACDAFLLSRLDQGIQDAERINLWLQVVIKHGLESGHLWVHNHDVAGNAILTKGHTLVSHSHRQVIHTMVLQGLGNLYGTCAITIRLDHTYQLGFRLHERTIVVEVGNHGIQVDFQSGLMHLANQEFGQLVETKLACSLQQDNLITQRLEHFALYKFLHMVEEEFF